MLFLDEDKHTGSLDSQHDKKDEEMVKEQQRLTKEIEDERMKIKAMRE